MCKEAEKRVKGRWPLRGWRGRGGPSWGTGARPLLRAAARKPPRAFRGISDSAETAHAAAKEKTKASPKISRNGKAISPTQDQPQWNRRVALELIRYRDKGLSFWSCAAVSRILWILERRVFFALRRGAGVSPLYPTRASAALDPARGTRPLTLFCPFPGLLSYTRFSWTSFSYSSTFWNHWPSSGLPQRRQYSFQISPKGRVFISS